MRIQFHHQFYAGPDAPGPAQPRKLVRFLAERGYSIDVVACDFNIYNEQDEPEESFETQAGGGVRVYRLPAPRGVRASLIRRLRTYLSFAWVAYRFGKKLEKPDLVMTSIQPLFVGVSAMLLARRWKRPFLLEIRDLWPDALVVKGAIPRWMAWPLQSLAHLLYRGANRIVSLTPGIKMELIKKGVPVTRIDLFPNGFDAEAFRLPEQTRSGVRKRYGWGHEKFVAIYTGTHTEVTAIDVLVRAAAVLRERKDIRFDFFGSGQSKPAVMQMAKEMNLDNVYFHDPVPKAKVPEILAGADAGLMALFRSPLVHIYFENKFIDYMGSRLPILAAMEGVQADLIMKCGAGRIAPTFDHEALAGMIADAADHPDTCRLMGERGYRFISQKLIQDEILERYAHVLETLIRGDTASLKVWDPLQQDVKY